MNAEAVKSLIRKGPSDEIIFIECPTSPLDIINEIQSLVHTQKGHIIIGVKPDGAVVGLKKNEESIKSILEPLIDSTSLKLTKFELIRYYHVFVIHH